MKKKFGSDYEQLLRLVFSCFRGQKMSWSIGHILEHEFFCFGRLGSQGSKGKKVDLRNSEQLLRVVFSTFGGQIFF